MSLRDEYQNRLESREHQMREAREQHEREAFRRRYAGSLEVGFWDDTAIDNGVLDLVRSAPELIEDRGIVFKTAEIWAGMIRKAPRIVYAQAEYDDGMRHLLSYAGRTVHEYIQGEEYFTTYDFDRVGIQKHFAQQNLCGDQRYIALYYSHFDAKYAGYSREDASYSSYFILFNDGAAYICDWDDDWNYRYSRDKGLRHMLPNYDEIKNWLLDAIEHYDMDLNH